MSAEAENPGKVLCRKRTSSEFWIRLNTAESDICDKPLSDECRVLGHSDMGCLQTGCYPCILYEKTIEGLIIARISRNNGTRLIIDADGLIPKPK